MEPETYQCVVSINGVTDLPAFMAKFDRKDPFENRAYNIWLERIGDPEKELDHIKSISPIHNLEAMTAQILLMHGEDDKTVPIEQSQSFYRQAKEAGVDIQFNSIPDVGHGNWSDRTSTNILTDLDTFLMMCMS